MNASAQLTAEVLAQRQREVVQALIAVLREQGATRIQISRSESERLRFWSGRKNAFPTAGRISPSYYCMDGTVPRHSIGPLLAHIEAMERKYGLRCINVFHASDGNMHPLILFNGNDQDEWHRAEAFGSDILEACVELGGTVTGEHGMGIEKINSMCVQFSPEERDTFHAVSAPSTAPVYSIPTMAFPPVRAAPSTARCTCAAACCRILTCRGSFLLTGASHITRTGKAFLLSP